MNILVLTPYVAWPLDHGGRMRTWHLLHALAREHHVVNVAVARSPKHRDDAQELAKIGITVRPCLVPEPGVTTPASRIAKLLSLYRPFFARSSLPARWWNRDFSALVRQAVADRPPDLVVIETLWMDVYRRLLRGIPFVASSQNIESDVLLDAARKKTGLDTIVAERDAALLRRDEARYFREAVIAVAVSDDDAGRMEAIAGRAQTAVVANGVDADAIPFRPRTDTRGPLLFVGSFDYPANVDAATFLVNEVLPKVRERSGAVGVVLAGRDPPREVRALAGNGVEVTGTIADLTPVYDRAGAVVVPLRYGGGSRIKILEAFAVGRAVITTAVGASGLAVKHDQHLLVANTPDEIAAAHSRLDGDPALVARLVQNARAFVQERHAWPALEAEFARLIRRFEKPAT